MKTRCARVEMEFAPWNRLDACGGADTIRAALKLQRLFHFVKPETREVQRPGRKT
jgi:hypothetical protein